MKNIFLNIIFLILTIFFTWSCCLIPADTILKSAGMNTDIKIKDVFGEAQDVDNGSFTGVPRNVKVSNILISGQAIDVDISGNYAYVTNDLGALYIINISDRERPYVTGKCRDIDAANIVLVKEDFAYVSYTKWITGENNYYSECGFKIVDIRDKDDPKVVGDFVSGDNNRKTVFGLYIEGSYAYLNTSTYDNGSETNSFEVVDISKKESPVLISELELEGSPANITVDASTAYININHYDYDIDDYMGRSELLLIDISNKENPFLKSVIEVPSNSWGIYYSSGMVYLSSHHSENGEYNNSMLQIVAVTGEEPY